MPRRTDNNQTAIVEGLRSIGAHVQILSMVGDGCPDLVVTDLSLHTGREESLYVEVKTEDGKRTPAQIKWREKFPENGPYIIARDIKDVLKWFGRN